jgi:hypothetical protein
MSDALTFDLAGRDRAEAASADGVRCACCEAAVPRGEWKACATCRRPICSACTRWYGHFMLVCDDCRLATW